MPGFGDMPGLRTRGTRMSARTEVATVDSRGAPAKFVDELLGLPEQASPDELLELGVQAFNNSGMWMARAGRCFQRLRDFEAIPNDGSRNGNGSVPNGGKGSSPSVGKHGFLATLESRGISKSHAYRAIQLIEYIGSLPEAEARRMARVPYTKILAIANADPEVVEELLREGALDGKDPLSVRDLRARIGKTEEARHRAEARAETAEATVEYLRRELDNRAKQTQVPTWYTVSRGETVALTESLSLSLGDLEKLSNEYISGAPHKTDADRTYARMAAATLYHALAGVVANGQILLRQLVSEFGKEITGEDRVAVCALDGDELKRQVALRAMLVRNNEAERQARQVLRASDKPRGRGRPKGSRNKKKAGR